MSNSMSIASEHLDKKATCIPLTSETRDSHSKSSLFSPRSLPALLRGMGAMTLLASVSIYLLQGWEVGSDLTRYLLLLAHTVGLAVIGVLCSRWLKEQKGARLLLILTLVFISANFAIIGGFVLSLWGQPIEGLYGAVTWVVSNTGGSLMLLLGSLAVLVPLTYLGFTVTARRSAKSFSVVYLVSNFLLLLPTRNEFVLAGVLLSLLGFVIYIITKARSKDVTLATREGFIARLILFVPLGIMLGRNMMHSVGEIIPLIVGLTVFILMRQVALNLSSRNFVRKILEFFSILPIFMAAGSLSALMTVQFNASFSVSMLGFAVVASGLLFELSARASSGKGFYSVLGSLIITGCFAANVFYYESIYSSLACIVAGLGLAGFGYMTERRVALILGSLMSIAGSFLYLADVFNNFDLNGWVSLAVIGVGAIVLGSYIEKQGEQIKLSVQKIKTNLTAWEY